MFYLLNLLTQQAYLLILPSIKIRLSNVVLSKTYLIPKALHLRDLDFLILKILIEFILEGFFIIGRLMRRVINYNTIELYIFKIFYI